MNNNVRKVTSENYPTDAGREGELIFKRVYDLSGSHLPVKRLWISSMEDAAIREGFTHLKDGAEYKNLCEASICRAKADWLIGMNATRAFTTKYYKRLVVGRVQTPTLAMLVERDSQINHFQKEAYYNVHLDCNGLEVIKEKIFDKAEADRLKAACNGASAVVEKTVSTEKTVNPPKLYDLTTLQRESNRYYGYTAKETLDFTQSLYEKKLVTYPRTDSQYLTEDMEQTAEQVIRMVCGKFGYGSSVYPSEPNVKRVMDNKRVSDHHAIIPTAELESCEMGELSKGERDILLLISTRLLCATGPKHLYVESVITVSCAGEIFTAKGKSIKEIGWKAIEAAFCQAQGGRNRKAVDKELVAIPFVAEGTVIDSVTAGVTEHFTTPPKPYSEDTLLSAMETAGNKEFDEDTEKKGLGTPATRASIIEKLVSSGYALRKGKQIVPTSDGTDLIAVLPEYLKSAAMTAEWENKLLLMEKGQLEGSGFMQGIDKSVRGVWTLTEAGKSVELTAEMASDIFKKGVSDAKSKKTNDSDALADSDVDTIHYWIYAPGQNADKWEECYKNGYMLLGWGEIGDLGIFSSKDEMKQQMKQEYGDSSSYKNSAHATWQFVHDIKVGDIVFAKKGNNGILGKGIVESDYEYDADRTDEYSNVRKVNWINKGNWTINHQAPQKTLTDITPYSDFVQEIKDLFEDDDMVDDEQELTYPEYTAENFLDDVYMSEEDYSRLVGLLRNKKNIILQGAPGVGKTYAAKRLAYSMMGVKDIERVMMVQFHQSYSYEDFIMGFRPSSTGFELRKGVFYNFCKKAEIDSDNEYFFIIDEINRGNLSKIFGELFMLIENDKRGNALQLLYSDEKFAVPESVYIIGMMNTADRSLAMLDYALRRRFAFFDIKPGFETPGFREYRMALDNEKFNKLISCVENLNGVIASDESLGEGFCIGHSYFCNLQPDTINDDWLYGVLEYELIPLLKEYWFDEPMKVKDWSENLRSAIK